MKLTTNIKNAVRAAVNWRLIVIWLAAVLLPMLLLAFPVWGVLSANLDRSVHAAELAQQLDMIAFADLVSDLRRNGSALAGGALAAVAITLLLSPLLTGAAVTLARSQEKLRCRDLFLGGVAEYPRMFRMLLWGLLLLALAGAAGGALMTAAGSYAKKVTVVSESQPWRYAAMAVALLLLAFVNATLDAGRAELAIDRRRTSAVKAWWRGLKLLLRRPGAVIGIYAILTLVGAVLTAALSVARLNVANAGVLALVAGLLITQLITLVLYWMRTSRLFALMTVAATEKAMQHSQIVH